MTTRKPAGVKHPVRPMQAASPAPVAPTGGEEIPGLATGCIGHFPGVPGDSPGLLVQDLDAFSHAPQFLSRGFSRQWGQLQMSSNSYWTVEVGGGLIAVPVTGSPEQDRRLSQVLLAVRAQGGLASGLPESVQVVPRDICVADRLAVAESRGLVAPDYVVLDRIEADHGLRPD